MMNNNDKHDETIHSHTKDVPTFLLPSFSNLPKSMSNYKKANPKERYYKNKQLCGILYICMYILLQKPAQQPWNTTNIIFNSNESSKQMFSNKWMCITHLSALNDEFADTPHEHVLSLAVFLVATQQRKLQTETLIIKWQEASHSWL